MNPETELDQALEAAKADPNQGNFFYDALLNAELFVPVQLASSSEGTWTRVKMQDKFFPLFLKKDDLKVVPIFDRLDRLKNWAGEKSLDYLSLKGHVVVSLMGEGVELLLNAGTPWNYTVAPHIVDRLRAAMRPVQPS